MKTSELALRPYPVSDGWRWLYRFYERAVKLAPFLRHVARGYFLPKGFEVARHSILFRVFGVHIFGRFVPTGGIAIRRLTRARMAPYTLTGTSVRAASDFFYRACVFEALHLPFMLTLLALSAHRLWIGRPDLALENLVVNIAVNVYPMLHHRHTRARITSILRKAHRNPPQPRTQPLSSPRGQ